MNKWFVQSDSGYIEMPSEISNAIAHASVKEPFDLMMNKCSYQVIRVSNDCAWQRNKFSNNVRPIIRNVDEMKDDKEVLNDRNTVNPFAGNRKDQHKFMSQDFQRFGELLPGTSL